MMVPSLICIFIAESMSVSMVILNLHFTAANESMFAREYLLKHFERKLYHGGGVVVVLVYPVFVLLKFFTCVKGTDVFN